MVKQIANRAMNSRADTASQTPQISTPNCFSWLLTFIMMMSGWSAVSLD